MEATEKDHIWTAIWNLKNDHPDEALTILTRMVSPKKQAPSSTITGDDPYQTEFHRSPNQSSGRIEPKFIVVHSSYGSFNGDKSWILNKKSKVSYHFLINPKTGNRVQFVDTIRKAWHAGKSFWKGLRGLNSHSIGVAFTGKSDRKASEKEIDSMAWLIIGLMRRHKITKDGIVTHQMIAPERKDDTGKYNYTKVLERIEQLS